RRRDTENHRDVLINLSSFSVSLRLCVEMFAQFGSNQRRGGRSFMRLEGKVALVTGGAQGIGRQIALTFAREGARLMIGDVKDEGGRATVREIEAAGGAAACRPCDVGRFDDVQALVDATVETHGRLDV